MCCGRGGVPFLSYEKGFGGEKFSGLRGCSQGPLGSTRLEPYVIVVAFTSPPLLVADSTFFFPSHRYALTVLLRAMRGSLLRVGVSLTVLNDQSK